MHAITEQLLEIKDGLQNDVSAHVENCQKCLQELDALRSIQQTIFTGAEQAPHSEIWDRIVNSAAKPTVHKLFSDTEEVDNPAMNDHSTRQEPVELLVAQSAELANYSSLSKAVYSLAASILVTGFIGLYIFGQQSTKFEQADLLNANIQALMLNSRGMEHSLQQVSMQHDMLTVSERAAAERLYWRLTYVDQLINQNSANDAAKPEQIEDLWKSRIGALQELNQLYFQRQKTLDDSVI